MAANPALDVLNLPQQALDAFVRMAGNFDKGLSPNLLKAWAHNLQGLDPVEIERACKRCMDDPELEHFPRWSQFAAKLPATRSDVYLDPEKFFSPAPGGDGQWLGNADCLTKSKREEIALRLIKDANGRLSRWQRDTVEHLCPGLLESFMAKTLPGTEAQTA